MGLLERPSDDELLRIAKERDEKKRNRMIHVHHRITTNETLPPSLPMEIRDRTGNPKSVRLPWSVLVADNEKYRIGTAKNGKPLMRLSAEYRAAKAKAQDMAIDQIGVAPFPLDVPLAFVARVYVPNRERSRDVANFGKLVHDALEGVAYKNDAQLVDIRWIRVGEDVDAPRCEITITPL